MIIAITTRTCPLTSTRSDDSLWRRANARNVSFQSLYGGQFTLSTQLINPHFCVLRPHRRSTTVSLETNPLVHFNSIRLDSPYSTTRLDKLQFSRFDTKLVSSTSECHVMTIIGKRQKCSQSDKTVIYTILTLYKFIKQCMVKHRAS